MVSAAVRLATFNIPQYARMTMVDEMDFGSLGEKKKAIFCVIPVDDSSMNYLVGMLYTQCFQALYRRADEKHNGRLPVPVRVIQDEWANVAQPESYPKILATCRSYNIGLNIIVQNIQQIKALYEKEWESIIGNCDTLLFLGGGNEPTSLEFIVKLLGKETIATRTRGQTKGRSGSSSTNFQQTGRDLMTIDEVRKLDTHTVVAAAITSRKAKNSLPTHILLENVPGLAPTSLLLLEQLRTIDRKRLRGYIGRISKEKMLEVDAALAISIGISLLGSKPYR